MQDNPQDIANAENFKNAFKPYLIISGIVYAILMSLITCITVVLSIPSWEFSNILISWLMDIGAIFDG